MVYAAVESEELDAMLYTVLGQYIRGYNYGEN
jgi:hypothetical protein